MFRRKVVKLCNSVINKLEPKPEPESKGFEPESEPKGLEGFKCFEGFEEFEDLPKPNPSKHLEESILDQPVPVYRRIRYDEAGNLIMIKCIQCLQIKPIDDFEIIQLWIYTCARCAKFTQEQYKNAQKQKEFERLFNDKSKKDIDILVDWGVK